MRKLTILLFLLSLFMLVGCTQQNQTIDEDDLVPMTLEELAQFDGREGRSAYIAVNGNIYDVTGSARWPNGNHNGYQAGQDLTDMITNISPHGTSVLNQLPLIGILVDEHATIFTKE